MMKRVLALMTVMGTIACGSGGGSVGCGFAAPSTSSSPPPAATAAPADRKYLLERVGEAAVVQLYADAFRDLSLKDKTLVWHLYQAAIAGRDMGGAEHCRHAAQHKRRRRASQSVRAAVKRLATLRQAAARSAT